MTSKNEMIKVLMDVERLFKEALPKFNWGASCLDANAIKLLNEVPIAVKTVLNKFSDQYNDGVPSLSMMGFDAACYGGDWPDRK